MKNISKILVSFILSLLFINLSYSYDQVFSSVKLRHGLSYNFWDKFINKWTWDIWLESYNAQLIEKGWYDYNWKNDDGLFSWSQEIKNKSYIIKAWENIKSYESTGYDILYVPSKRKSNNLEIIYTANYYRNTSDWWDWPISHTEYQPYEITWCWDGIVDNYTDIWWDRISEECDPNDPNKTNWNWRTCNTSCKLEWWWGGWSTPSCTELTVSNPSWVDSLTTNLSCTWENVLSYSIDCWNDTQASLTDWNGSCIYSVPWTYTPTCYVSPTVTSPSCTKTIEVIDSSNSCESIVTWTQVSEVTEVTPGLCTTWFSLATGTFQWTTIWETTNYTWSCTDWINIFSWLSCNASYTNTDITNSCVWWITSPLNSTLTSTNPNLCTTWFTSETFDSVTNWNTTNYTWNCRDDITSELTNWWSCNASYSSWNSWWDPYQCRDITYDDGTITCEWNSQVDTFRLTCNGTELFSSDITTIWNTNSATFSCNDTEASCHVYNREVIESSWYVWRTTPACKLTDDWWGCTWWSCWGWSSRDYCWDGIVQRPNDDGFDEQCDYWDLPFADRPEWCTSTCKIEGIETIPASGQISFWNQTWPFIIWNSMNPYDTYSLEKPYIKNDSNHDLYFDELCVVRTDWNSLDWVTQCTNIWVTLFPYDRFDFYWYPDFIWNTYSIPSWSSQSNILTTTIRHEWELYDWSHLSKDMEIIVSKPSISTTWGWTSYVSSNTDTSNLDSDSKNFVWVWVWSSSYSDEITDTDSKNTIWYEIDDLNNNSNVWTTSYSSSNSSNLSDFESYNGIENAYIIRNKNLVIDSDLFSSLSWPRTYIVESWNIIINSDIIYDNNIAFVAKGWNITIKDTVEKLKGTYIAIPNISWDYWKIRSSWETLNQLVINGALYWNSSDLVEDRTYIKYENNQISVWTIVSFGSSVFRDPAPLVSTFVSDYQKSAKTAK